VRPSGADGRRRRRVLHQRLRRGGPAPPGRDYSLRPAAPGGLLPGPSPSPARPRASRRRSS
jgi:hypothetical protein